MALPGRYWHRKTNLTDQNWINVERDAAFNCCRLSFLLQLELKLCHMPISEPDNVCPLRANSAIGQVRNGCNRRTAFDSAWVRAFDSRIIVSVVVGKPLKCVQPYLFWRIRNMGINQQLGLAVRGNFFRIKDRKDSLYDLIWTVRGCCDSGTSPGLRCLLVRSTFAHFAHLIR